MAELVSAFFSAPDVPLTAPGDLPTCLVKRTDTGATVASGNMVDLGGGLFSFAFATVDGLEYAALCDGDPTVSGQTFPGARFTSGSISGTATARIEVDVPAILVDTGAIDGRLPSDPADESLQQASHATTQAGVALVLADTDAIDARLPSDPADESLQQASHTQTQADIAALNDIDQAGVQAAMTAQGYTTGRAPLLDNLDALVSSRGTADPGDAMDLVVDAVDTAAIATGAIDDDALAADTDTYQAKVWFFDDNENSRDRYLVAFLKNGEPVLSGVTVPTLRVIDADTELDLLPATTLVAIAATGYFKLFIVTAGQRIVSGKAYMAETVATIDGSPRTWPQPVGRDTT